MNRRGWGIIAESRAQQAATPGAAVLAAFALLLVIGSEPARAHQDCGNADPANNVENTSTCASCKKAVLPGRGATPRCAGEESAALLPGWLPGFPTAPQITRVLRADGWDAYVRPTGVMLVGNVRLLN